MQRRHFLKLAFGLAAGAAALAASARAAPLMPQPLDGQLPDHSDAHPAVTSGDEVGQLQPQQVRWGRHRGWGHRRYWGWRRRRHWGWRRRHWGWRRRRWHRRWRRRYW